MINILPRQYNDKLKRTFYYKTYLLVLVLLIILTDYVEYASQRTEIIAKTLLVVSFSIKIIF